MNDEGSTNKPNDGEPMAQQPPVQPVEPPAAAPVTQPTPKGKKMKKPVLIGLIVAAVLVVLGAGSALAYNLWYQNPDKVLADSMSNLMTRDSFSGDGTLAVTSEESDVVFALSNKMHEGQMSLETTVDIEADDVKLSIAGNAVYDKDGILYVKVTNAAELLDTLIQTQMAESDEQMSEQEKAMASAFMKAMFEPIVEKIDGQWIKITPEDLDDTAETQDQMQCVNDAMKLLSDKTATKNELTRAYRDNAFMVMTEELGVKDGNIGFVYTLDEAKAEAFGAAVEETEIGKALADCETDTDDQQDATADADAEQADMTLELWADRWSHELASVKVVATLDDKETMNFDYTPNYDEEVKIDVPTEAVTLKELSEQLNGMFQL